MPKRRISGPDPAFPYLSEVQRFKFPDPVKAEGDIICIGGNLSPGMLLSAYESGIFPWYNAGDPILWQSPDPRFIILPETLHISESMKKVLRRRAFEVRMNTNFAAVIKACSQAGRRGQDGTWITDDIIEGYTALYKAGYVISAEAYFEGKLAGGCYGVLLKKVFFGESMFAYKSNASKAAFLTLAQKLFADGIEMIDCQVPTEHLRSLGGFEISRSEFLRKLRLLVGRE